MERGNDSTDPSLLARLEEFWRRLEPVANPPEITPAPVVKEDDWTMVANGMVFQVGVTAVALVALASAECVPELVGKQIEVVQPWVETPGTL